MNFDLDAPARAVKEYTNSLDAQLAAQRQAIDVQVQSISLGDKEAKNLQDLAKIRFDGAQAITAFQQAHQLHPDAMSDKQYQEQLSAYEKYWGDLYDVTKDGQDRISAAQSDWHNGTDKAIADFLESQRDRAKQAYDLTTKLI
jgi:lambda family phage tail tape measure protein